ncbi:MAG TPA: hypothetical protein VHA52_07660 [Candidatus Babeliaceae bacterium]|nr:hypothetical protein [Candidatus Babeliaceae bacterium]
MRKNALPFIIVLISTFFAARVQAQYNLIAPYYLSSGYIEATPADIIATGPNFTMTLVIGADPSGYNDLILKKTDQLGHSLFDVVYAPNNGANLFPTKIIEGRHNEYYVTGVYNNVSLQIYGPFVAKFDNSGSFLWLNCYPTNAPSFVNFARTDIVLAGGDKNEDYLVETPAGPDDTSSYPQDVYTDVLKIDSAGNLLWHNKYIPNWARSGYSAIQDDPSTICYIGHTNTAKQYKSSYLIAGTTQWWSFSDQFYLYYLGIDSNGNIFYPYSTYDAPQYPMYVSSVFDTSAQQPAVCLGYTLGNTYLVSSYSASAIALTKVTPFYAPYFTEYYYIPATYATENYGTSIALTGDHNYMMGTMSFFNSPFPPSYSGRQGGLLKISNTGNPIFYKQFNIAQYWAPPMPVADVASGGAEYYAMAGTYTNASSSGDNVHIVTTNTVGFTCNMTPQTIADTIINHVPTPYNYLQEAETGTNGDLLIPVYGYSQPSLCIAGNLRETQTTSVNELQKDNGLKVYPTLLSDGNNQIQIVYNAESNTQLEISAYSIDGRLIGKCIFNVSAGQNNMSWDMPLVGAGNYVMHIVSADMSLNKTIQISKL